MITAEELHRQQQLQGHGVSGDSSVCNSGPTTMIVTPRQFDALIGDFQSRPKSKPKKKKRSSKRWVRTGKDWE